MKEETKKLRKLRPMVTFWREGSALLMTWPAELKALAMRPPTMRAPRMVPGSALIRSQAKVMDSQLAQG
jgi:hypothetical protein